MYEEPPIRILFESETKDENIYLIPKVKPDELKFNSYTASNDLNYYGHKVKENELSQLEWYYLICSLTKGEPIRADEFGIKFKQAMVDANLTSLVNKGLVEEFMDEEGNLVYKAKI